MVDAAHRCVIKYDGLKEHEVINIARSVFEQLSSFDKISELKDSVKIEDSQIEIIGYGSGIRCDFCNKMSKALKEYVDVELKKNKGAFNISFGKCHELNYSVDYSEKKENTLKEDKQNLINLFMKR